MSSADVLIATALEMERNAVRDAAAWREDIGTGVRHWERKDANNFPDYLLGEYALADGGSLTIALSHPTRMGGNFMSNIVSTLVERLKPRYLAMCGVCAGNPSDVALGDVVIGNPVFQYDEGKRTVAGFEGDLFPTPMDISWLRHAYELRPDGLPSYGAPSQSDATLWLLERLSADANPVEHPAYTRYFPSGSGSERIRQLEAEGLLRRRGLKFVMTKAGREFLDGKLAYKIDAPVQLPFAIKVGPMASGNAVVKDGLTWNMLKRQGQRSTVALEMEAATIGVTGYTRSLSKWIVVKGVMDHADPNKDDRYKPFAAKASAEVLLHFLEQNAGSVRDDHGRSQTTGAAAAGTPVTPVVTPAGDIERPAEPSLTPAEQARKWLADLKVPLAPESLDLYIRSGVPDVVANLLQAGLSPDTLLNGVPPLELALSLFDDRVGEPDAARTAVLRAVVAAGPRDVAQAAHDALAKPKPAPKLLIALLRAGVELDAEDDTGQSLAARAMRRDDDAYGDAASNWTDLLIREGKKPPPASGAWILLWAAFTGRVHLVERLLAAGVPVDASLQGTVPFEPIRDSELGFWWPGGTSLHRLLARAQGPYAMMYPEADLYSPEMLRMLLRHGASADAIDGIGRTPLHIAAREGLEDAATEFIGRPETDLTRCDANGETVLDSALHWPRSGGIARKLLARGLPRDPAYQARILHRAAYNRDLEFLREVLDAGVDPDAVSGDVPGALMELAHHWDFLIPSNRRSCVPCLTLLLEHNADVSLRDRHGWTALHWLALGDEVDAIELLLEAGIDPDTAGDKGRTALMNCKSPAIAERLLAAGAQQSKRDDYGFDALDHALIYGRTDAAALLRAPNHAPSRESGLIHAIMERNESAVVEFLAVGVPLDTVDPVGRPLLHVAANVLSPEMLLLLLDRGAIVDARDALGHTALDECLDLFKGGNEDYERCVTLLLDRGATMESVNAPDDRGEAAIFRGFRLWHVPSIAMRLLSAGRDARRRDGTTALMAAVDRGSADQVAYLLRAGVDAQAVDSRGRTALHYAARCSGDEMEYRDKAGHLLRAGAGLDVPDNNSETPLIAAVGCANHNMIDFLLDQGADPKRSNAAGENLLRIALRAGDVSLVNRFIARS